MKDFPLIPTFTCEGKIVENVGNTNALHDNCAIII